MPANRWVIKVLKSVDLVPHHYLLKKLLKVYHMDNIHWIAKWLTSQKQHVLLNEEASNYIYMSMYSVLGVPQGTVLGPL